MGSHAISCVSAAEVLKALDRDEFDPLPIGITKSGTWLVGGADPRCFSLDSPALPCVEPTDATRHVVLDPGLAGCGLFALTTDGTLEPLGYIDVVFPLLHGKFSEDGTVQGLFEMVGIPYVGCGVFASAAGMDKHMTKMLFEAAGIEVVPWVSFDTRRLHAKDGFVSDIPEIIEHIKLASFRPPLFVKPSRAGSSLGVHRVEALGVGSALASAMLESSTHVFRVLVEQAMDARDIECAVLADNPRATPEASLPGEVVLDETLRDAGGFYDFETKYTCCSGAYRGAGSAGRRRTRADPHHHHQGISRH